MANTKLKFGLATLLVAGAASSLVVQHQTVAKLRGENQSFRQQISRLRSERENPSNGATMESDALAGDQFQELLRLRGEVGTLREQTNELAKLRQENQDLLSRIAQPSDASTNQVSADDQYILRQTHTSTAMRTVLMAIKKYASNHSGQYPVSFDQLTASGSLQTTNFPGNVGLADFQMEKEGTFDEQGYRIIMSLRVPIPTKPGAPSLSILGEISDNGVARTKGIYVSP
jgi:hypothetical protein